MIQAVLIAEFTGIGLVSLLSTSAFSHLSGQELQIWLTELHAFLLLLCLFGWKFELAEFKSASECHGKVFSIQHSSVAYESFLILV